IGLYKADFANSLIQATLGMSYEEFKDKGKTLLPPKLYGSLLTDIRAHRSGAELIIAGFAQTEHVVTPVLFKISWDTVAWCRHFAVIGTGTILAEASLFNRSQNTEYQLGPTLYHVYEAK